MLADRADHIWPTVVRLTHSIFVHARCTVGWISATFRDLRHCSSHVELQRDRTHFLEYNVQCAIYIYAYQLWVKRFSFTPILINLFQCSFPFSRNWGSTSHPHGISMGPTGPMGIPNVDSSLLDTHTDKHSVTAVITFFAHRQQHGKRDSQASLPRDAFRYCY